LNTIKTLTIGTHNQAFHCDEIIAIAIIQSIVNCKIIRTRDDAILKQCNILVDTGGEYDGKTKFDHHHFDKKHPLYGKSSAGLVFNSIIKEFRYKFLPHVDVLIENADIRDTQGPFKCESRYDKLFDLIRKCNQSYLSSEEQDKLFNKLVCIFMKYIQNKISYEILHNFLTDKVEEIKKERNRFFKAKASTLTTILISGYTILHTEEYQFISSKFIPKDNILFLSWDSVQSCWALHCNTKYAIIEDIDNAIFIHHKGHLAKIKGNYNEPEKICKITRKI